MDAACIISYNLSEYIRNTALFVALHLTETLAACFILHQYFSFWTCRKFIGYWCLTFEHNAHYKQVHCLLYQLRINRKIIVLTKEYHGHNRTNKRIHINDLHVITSNFSLKNFLGIAVTWFTLPCTVILTARISYFISTPIAIFC